MSDEKPQGSGQPVLMGDGDGYNGHDSNCGCDLCQEEALREYPEG